MITVIKDPDTSNRKEFTCFKCKCVYQADEWDYDYWNDVNGEWAYRVACPICGDRTWHKYNQYTRNYEGVKDVK